jgi:hypothetical protein
MLDVEDVEQRQKRLRMYIHRFLFSPLLKPFLFQETIFERLNGEGSSASEPPSLSFDFGVRRTFAVEPPNARTCHNLTLTMEAGLNVTA